MFWGVTLESGKRYSQVVDSSYHLSMAALEPTTKDMNNKFVSVMIEHGKAEFLLCTLEYERVMQVNLDLLFVEGEEVSFFLNGEGTVHLTGYVTDDLNERSLAENILSEEESEEESEGSCPESDGDPTAISSLMLDEEEEEEKEEESDWTPDKDVKKKKVMLDGKHEIMVPDTAMCPPVKHIAGVQKMTRGMNHKMILMREKKKKCKEIEAKHKLSENELVTVSSGSEVGEDEKEEKDGLEEEADAASKRKKLKQGGDKMPKKMKQLQKSGKEDGLSHDALKVKDQVNEVEIVDGSAEMQGKDAEARSQEMNSEEDEDEEEAEEEEDEDEEESSGSEEETTTAEEDSDKEESSEEDENTIERIPKGFAIKENATKKPLPSVNSVRKKGLKEKEMNRSLPLEKKIDSSQKAARKSLGINASASCGGIEVLPLDNSKIKQEKGQGDVTSEGAVKKGKKSPFTSSKNVKIPDVQYDDIRVGSGAVAKPGKFVHVYYVGRLPNGKVFEMCSSGDKPKSFRLGRGEIMKGWDRGIEGMRVGGKRRIIVPPHLGYGNKKKGSVPPNSILHFEIELKAIS